MDVSNILILHGLDLCLFAEIRNISYKLDLDKKIGLLYLFSNLPFSNMLTHKSLHITTSYNKIICREKDQWL